jgi:DNA polymerase III delta prime subunit
MTSYLRWSLRQLYLLVFSPTQFKQQGEACPDRQLRLRYMEHFGYLLKMLPWIVALAALGELIAGHTSEALGNTFAWRRSWIGMLAGVGCGVGLGMGLGILAGSMFGARAGVGFGVVTGVLAGVRAGAMPGIEAVVWAPVIAGVGLGVAAGVLTSMVVGGGRFGIVTGTIIGVLTGALAGVGLGVGLGIAAGVGAAVAFWSTHFRLVMYPLEVALSAATYFAGRRWPHVAARAWPWCPVAWNEVIWLPLPFVGKLLALLVQQDREEGFRQIAFVAAERRFQRHAALGALTEVAISDLQTKSVSELAVVTEKLQWTMDAPAELPPELTAALLRCSRVAQHVSQYLALHSTYLKGEALKRAVEEVDTLQRSLVATPGQATPLLLQVANEWRRLLKVEHEALQVLVEAIQEIPNPFVFGNPVAETEHNVFTGRRDIVRQVEASVLGTTQAPTLLLHGPRRMGKTSILNQLPRLLGPDFVPAVIDCQNPAVTASVEAALRYLSRTISEGLRRRQVTVEPLTPAALEREPFAVFDDWLDCMQQAMPAKMRILLCLDEYERLKSTLDAGWGATFLDALRHWLQHRPHVVLMFTGAHTFAELGSVWTDRFISARRVRVSFLTCDEVRPLLTQPIPKFAMMYAPGALEAIFAATNGQPFLTQAVAFELIQLLNEQQRKEATTNDVETAIDRALVSGGEYFANVWNDAGEQGQAVLCALAKGETLRDFPGECTWLQEQDLLNGAGQFAVPLMERWVREKT